MKTTLNHSTEVRIKESSTRQISLPEVVGYAGSLMAIGSVTLFLYTKWEDITQAQKTATFSLIAIALFVTGLIASNGADVRRRVSSYIYTLATISSWLAVYVTFPDDPPILQSFALATVIALLGYTISSTLLGHTTLFLASVGTLAGLGYEMVDSENLRLYTQISLVIAFALTWMAISSIRIINQNLGLILSNLAIIGTAQITFFREFENLSYIIGVGLIVLAVWLYTKIASWILAASAMTALGAGAAEFVISTMDNSLAAIIGMLLVGGIVTAIGIRAAGARSN
ncbi:MAG: hypothetical protein EB112_00475 [Actinobacteria bacterium]|nr:hypothetical protein [Actinomycetota bacterium]